MLTDERLIELQQDVSWYAQYDGTYRIDCGELLELLSLAWRYKTPITEAADEDT